MPLKQLADEATAKIADCLPETPGADTQEQISTIVEQAIIEAVRHVHEHYEGVVRVQSGPEADLAHKIAKEMKQAQTALIANLCALR